MARLDATSPCRIPIKLYKEWCHVKGNTFEDNENTNDLDRPSDASRVVPRPEIDCLQLLDIYRKKEVFWKGETKSERNVFKWHYANFRGQFLSSVSKTERVFA